MYVTNYNYKETNSHQPQGLFQNNSHNRNIYWENIICGK